MAESTDRIRFECPKCGVALRAESHRAGTKMQCPKCYSTFRVPQAEPEAAAPAGAWSRPAAHGQEQFPSEPRAPRGLNKAHMTVLRAFGKLRTALIAVWLLAVLVLLFTMQVRLGRIERGISSMTPDVTRIKAHVSGMKADLSSVDRMVSSIETEVSSIKSDVSSIESDVSSIESDVSSIETDVSSIETDVSSIETDVSSIESDVSHIKIWGVEIEK